MSWSVKTTTFVAVISLGMVMNVWAAQTQPSITVTYDKPASIQTDGSVKVMNAYHLSPTDVAKLNTTDLQAIKSCGTDGVSSIQLISKSVGGGEEVLQCAESGQTLNVTTSSLVATSNKCSGLYCPGG